MSQERKIIEALIDGDLVKLQSARESLDDERTALVMMLTFTNACFLNFPEDATYDDVASYVRDLRERHLPDADLKIVPTEAAIRGGLGQSEAFEGIAAVDLLAAQVVVTNDVAQAQHLVGADKEKFVTEVLGALE